MEITLNLNDVLLQEAKDLNPDLTLEKAIKTALQAYIEQQKRLKIFDLFGTIDYTPDYNHKNNDRTPFGCIQGTGEILEDIVAPALGCQ